MIKVIKSSELDNQKLNECPPLDFETEEFDFSKVIVKKPWGYEYLAYKGNLVSVWLLYIKKGEATSVHCHPNKKTALILLSGEAISSTLNNSFHLYEGDGLLLDKKVFHSTKAVSDNIILMEAEIPSIKNDIIRLHDKYGRESRVYTQQNGMCFDFENYKPILFDESEEKNIGRVRICIKNFQDDSSFRSDLRAEEDVIILLLSGEVFNKKNKEHFNAGDIFEINTPEEIEDIEIKTPVKILKIVKDKKKTRAILFDFDGVLADTMEDNFLAWQQAFKDYGIDIKKEDYFPLEGMKLIEIAKKISYKYNKSHIDVQTIVKLKNKYYLENHSLSFYPKVWRLIDLLKKAKCQLAIISASPRKKLRKTVPAEFLKKFDVVICEEDSKNGKPYPDPYLNAAKKLKVLPEECIVVENAPLGIKSAKMAGMYCIAICSTLNKSFLSEADEIVDKFGDLEKLEMIKLLINN